MAGPSLGKIIQSARLSLSPRRSQGWLGKQIGVTRQAVNLWENDKTMPDDWHMKRLERVLRIDLSRWGGPQMQAGDAFEGIGSPFGAQGALANTLIIDDVSPLLEAHGAALRGAGTLQPNHYYASDLFVAVLHMLGALSGSTPTVGSRAAAHALDESRARRTPRAAVVSYPPHRTNDKSA